MQPTKCKIFLKGFCPKKELCQNSHDIKNCMSGQNCPLKNQCPYRHPPLCKNFVKNRCGFVIDNKFIIFANCAFFHPVNVTFMRDDYTNTPFLHPPILPKLVCFSGEVRQQLLLRSSISTLPPSLPIYSIPSRTPLLQ